MNTNQKGDLTELKIATQLMALGHTVLFPYGDNSRYDLVFDDGESLKKVQCKSGTIKNGAVVFYTQSSTKRTTRGNIYTNIDYFGIYCSGNNTCYLVPIRDASVNEMHLRIELPKNGQKKNIKYAVVYKF